MREEQVTKYILNWLISYNWDIVCFDFPQSGTGHFLHPNGTSHKNKDSINPDIVAIKQGSVLFFENKDRFFLPDFIKQNKLIKHNNYTDAISDLLLGHFVTSIFYGIGLPKIKYTEKVISKQQLVDFIVGVEENGKVSFLFNKSQLAI